ncbi:hypothetical protein B484DRAFT_399880 [Ochromonadaceae sp. CCMP2298]|nr:hypothetical protein B484DRAFT_399880 [Ochromonadaceae sp. CCMP2298]
MPQGGQKGTDTPGFSPSQPRKQQSKDGDREEEAEQPQGRKMQGQGGQRNAGRPSDEGWESGTEGDEGEDGREGEKYNQRTGDDPEALGAGIRAPPLDSLSEKELNSACRAAGWTGEWLEESGGALQEPTHHEPQAPPDSEYRGLGEGGPQEVSPGYPAYPHTTTNQPHAARGEGMGRAQGTVRDGGRQRGI